MSKTRQLGCFLMLLGVMAMPCLAQNPAPAPDNGGGGGGGGGGRGRRGGFDPAQMRQRMLDQLKTALGASDEEFKALQPKIEQIAALRRDLYGGGMRGGRGGRGAGGAGGASGGADRPAAGGGGAGGADSTPPSAIRTAAEALQTTLDDKDAKPDDVKAKLAALRDARTKGKADLAKLQDDLKSLLTGRQEAVLVENGILE